MSGNIDGADLSRLKNIRDKWEDFKFPVAGLRINPTTSKPDYDFVNGEFLFDPAATETVIGGDITNHSYKVPTAEWRPHIHWMQSQAGNVRWQLEYKIIPAGATEPASWTTITTTTVAFTYTSGTIHQISTFPAINMTGFNSSATDVKVRISRLGADALDTYAVDARFIQFDIHVVIDDFGSTTEFGND